MIEGDITLLLAGVLAHNDFFWGVIVSRECCYGARSVALPATTSPLRREGESSKTVRTFVFYRGAQNRMERLTNRFLARSQFLFRNISMVYVGPHAPFYGVAPMPYDAFLAFSLASLFPVGFYFSGVGYFFSSAVVGLIGRLSPVGKILLGIAVAECSPFY